MIEHTIIGDASIPIIEQGLGRKLHHQSKDQEIADLKAQIAEKDRVITGRNEEIDNLTKTIDEQHDLLQDLRNKPLQVWACDICGGKARYTMKPLVTAICPHCLTAPAKWHKEGE